MKSLGGKADTWIRGHLEALEEDIISAYIARAQFARNNGVYDKGYSGNPEQSLLDSFLFRIETVHSQLGRYTDPVERPYNSGLPPPERELSIHDHDLVVPDYDLVNVTPKIMEAYLEFLDKICEPGDDDQYGSSAEHDIASLLVTAKRVHSGMIVSEWKYGLEPEMYDSLIQSRDEEGLVDALTDTRVEEIVAGRVGLKAQQRKDATNLEVRHVIEPRDIVEYFKNTIIPLTKEVEVLYFLNRTVLND